MKQFLLLAAIMISFLAANAQTDSLQQYTGKYKFPDGSPVPEMILTLENGVLLGNSVMGSSEFRKTEGDIFEIVAYSGTATFKRNTDSKITGVRIVVGSIDMDGTKTEGVQLSRYRVTATPSFVFINIP